MWPWRKRRRIVERGADREVEEQAGRLLCTYAGAGFRRDTACYLAGVIVKARWVELSEATARRLRAVPVEILEGLARDVLD